MGRRREPKSFSEKCLLILALAAALTVIGILFPIVWTALVFQMLHEPRLEKRNKRRFLLLRCPHCGFPPWKAPQRHHEYAPRDIMSIFSKRELILKTTLDWDCTNCGKMAQVKEKKL